MTEPGILTKPLGRRVLVTGARGFIGRALVDVLCREGWEVHGLLFDGGEKTPDGVSWHPVDLLAPGQARSLLEGIAPTHLVHLAWAPHRGIYESLDNFRWVEASLELLRSFAVIGGRRAVFAGSCAEYDWQRGAALAEGAPLASTTAYGAAKASLGRLFTDFCGFSALSGAWARLFFLFGPGEPRERLVPHVITSLLHGEPARCTHGEQVRDYLYVGDAAEALAALLGSQIEGPINVASGEPLRLKDLVAAIGRRLQGQHLIELGALPATPGEAERVVADVGRLRGELGWRPVHGIEVGIERTIDWWARRLTH